MNAEDAERIERLTAVIEKQAAEIAALENELLYMLQGLHLSKHSWAGCPWRGDIWARDHRCPECRRLEALIGHRRPAGEEG